jgi:lipid-binding SYLF domain-containing protein
MSYFAVLLCGFATLRESPVEKMISRKDARTQRFAKSNKVTTTLCDLLSERAIIVMLTTSEQENNLSPGAFEHRGGRMQQPLKAGRVIHRTIFILAILLIATVIATAQKTDPKRAAESAKHAQEAADAFTEIMNVADRAIPQGLLDRAQAIAVFPSVIKAGFIVGGRGGHGVISRRVKGGWSAPAFFDIGGEGSAVAGPVGRTAAASTDVLLKAAIISYSRSKGLFAGLEIKGVVIKPDDDENQRVYATHARELLLPGSAMPLAKMPAGVRIFPRTLARYSTK